MPPKPPKTKGTRKPQEEQREDSLQAVVLADSYETRFTPFTLERPRCLLPLVNTPIIEYTLEFLAHAGVHDIFVFCGSHTEQVEEYINTSKWKLPSSPFKNLVLLKSDATSVGDAMRDLDNRGLITGDFLLVSGDVVTSLSIEPALEQHRGRREKDKNAIMTMILREAGINHRTRATSHKPVFVTNPTIDRCLQYEEIHASSNSGKYINLDPDLLSQHAEIEVREDLVDCHIDICTPDVLGLWSDNFDYQSVRTSFLFGVLKDYELNGKTIHTYIVADQYAARIRSLRAYDAVSRDVTGRWTYPLCPDSNRVRGQNYYYSRDKVYQENEVSLSRTSKIRNGCVLGRGIVVGEGATISSSTLGRNCQIGQNAYIDESYLWDNVVIADGITVSGNKKITLAEPKESSASGRMGTSIVGDGGEGYEYLPDSDEDSDVSDSSARIYRNSQASASTSSVSTLASEDDDLEQIEDRPRRPSFMSETSEESAPNKDFHVEATASILDGLQKEDLPENIFLELNAFRMTLDASQHQVRQAVVAAFIRRIVNIESNGVGAREAVNKVFSNYKSVIERIIFDKDTEEKPDQIDFLLCVQRELMSRERGESLLLFVSKEVYDLELIEEDGILQWWADARSTEGGMANVRGLTQQFVTFLEEAEEDDESEEDEDE